MARKTVGYVQLQWTCPNCNTKNPGLVKVCKSCGSPQPDNVQFEKPEEQKIEKEGAVAAAGRKGADIHCGFCGARNPADAKICSQCGGDLTQGKARQKGKVVSAYEPDKVDKTPRVCAHCGTSNPPGSTTCKNCGANLVTEKAAVPAQTGGATGGAKKFPVGCIIAAAAVVIIVIVFFIVMAVLGGRTKDTLDAYVSNVHWERAVVIEGIGPVSKEGWFDDIPGDAEIGSCRQELYSTQSEYAPGAEEVCGTPYVEDTGSGAGEVVQDCEYHIYADYCDYTVLDWTQVDQVVLQGEDIYPQWPSPQLGSDQRLGSQSEDYTVVFETDQGEYTYKPGNEQTFEQYNMGSEWKLNVNTFNQIVSIEPQ